MRFPERILCVCFFLFWSAAGLFTPLLGQGTSPEIGPEYQGLSWEAFVEKVEKDQAIRFFYDVAVIPNLRMQLPPDSTGLLPVLRHNLQPLGLFVSQDRTGNVFLTRESPLITRLPASFFEKKNRPVTTTRPEVSTQEEAGGFLSTQETFSVQNLVVGDAVSGNQSRLATLSGYLKSSDDGGSVIGASMALPELKKGTLSNEAGFFSLTVPKGTYTLLIRSLNYKEASYQLELLSSGQVELEIMPKLVELEGVVLTAQRDNPVQNTQMGYERINLDRVKEIPLVLGERDIIKVAQLLPGIQSVGEGAAGFNVRGSPTDQNLFYLNKVPIYNTSHVFGFFSAFNSDAISDFALSKSNIPAKFGGRLASIFDVTAKQGNKRKYTASGGISPITGRLIVEGPIQREKSSFLIGVRSTYSDWLLRQVPNPDYENSSARFADGMANLAFEIGSNNRLNLFGYYSYDRFSFANTTDYAYENIGGSATWTRFFRQKHSLDFSLVYSRYGQEVGNRESALEAYLQDNAIEHKEARLDFSLRPSNRHEITLGASATLYDVDRGSFLPLDSTSQWNPLNLGQESGVEAGIYLSEQWEPNDRLSLSAGIRYNYYRYLGPQSVYEYLPGAPLTEPNILDTLAFGSNANVRSYDGLDYRAAIRYLIGPRFSVKASANRLHQYAFLLSNTIALAPNDKWKLSDYHIKPMTGSQYSLGFYTQLRQNTLELSVEGYYKEVDNLVEYKDGADLLINETPEQDVLQGDLKAFGLELMLKKPFGRINGWVNYTYARALVQVDSEQPEERINFGEQYPANYDKPHAFNLVGNVKFSRRLSLSGNVVYASGRPITYPTTVYYQNGIQLINYSARNEYRIPDYFRVDVSLRLEGNLRAKKLLHGSWVMSVYNLTGRRNAYSVYFASQNSTITGYRVSIFGSQIFSLSYDFKLGNYAD